MRPMVGPVWFDDIPVLGKLPPRQAAAKLRELGEQELADAVISADETESRAAAFGRLRDLFSPKAWAHTAHAFGFIPPARPEQDWLSVQHAGNIKADGELKSARIKITLDRLRVADYPGGGSHRILFDFYAQNQAPGQIEHLHFNATYRARQGEEAAIIGYPIFVGLHVGAEGVAFKCYTVNVKNDHDEALLDFLDTDVFKGGLKLISTLQPAIAPLSGMAVALTKSIAERHRNVPVQEFYMGLDFEHPATRARLAVGSYVAVQIPQSQQRVWDWNDWGYHLASGQLLSKDDRKQMIPYNYLVFGVSRYSGE